MDTSSDDSTERMPRYGIPLPVRDSREPHEKRRSVYLILASTLFERIAFYTLAANISLNLNASNNKVSSSVAFVASLLFSGVSYVSAFLFAIISDAKLGRGITILIGFLLYLSGYTSAVILTATNQTQCITDMLMANQTIASSERNLCIFWLFPTLIVISMGAGATQATMAVFGSEQIQQSKITSRYFDKYLFVVNVGGIIGTVVIRLIYNERNMPSFNDYFFPSVIAASSVLLSALLFIVGWKYYIHDNIQETVVANWFPVIINAYRARCTYEKQKSNEKNRRLSSEPSSIVNASQSIDNDDDGNEKWIGIYDRPATFLDFAKVPYGKFQDRIVNDVKSLRGLIIVFILLTPYWLITSQLSSIFPIQAYHMKGADNMNVTYMWLGDPTIIIIGILILNLFIYKRIDVAHRASIIANKFIIGMFFAFLTISMAGTVEIFRQNTNWIQENSTKENVPIRNVSSLHFCWTLPQNILLGVSEVFAMLASFEFSYFSSPRSAPTLFMSIRFFSVGISSFIAAGYFAGFSAAFAGKNLDFTSYHDSTARWPLYTYFFILAGVQLVFMIIFIVCQRKYQIIKLNPQQIQASTD